MFSYNKISETGWFTKNRHVLPQPWRLGSLWSRPWHWAADEGIISTFKMVPWYCDLWEGRNMHFSYDRRKAEEKHPQPFYVMPICAWGHSLHNLITSLTVTLLNIATMEIKFQHKCIREHIQTTVVFSERLADTLSFFQVQSRPALPPEANHWHAMCFC